MTDVDRTALIELLNRLGSDDDATVLDAGRGLHRMAAESGLSWGDLLRQDRVEDEPEVDDSPAVKMASPDDAETARLIERLLRTGISADLREDLTEMKRQLGEGSLETDDRRYLRALAQRLGA
jgi:hypothetical protein